MYGNAKRATSILALTALLSVTLPAAAKPARDLCVDRPGLDTPPCTIEPGRVMVEIGLADWVHDHTPDAKTDRVETAQLLTRNGIAEHAEIQLGWNGYAHFRSKDQATGQVQNMHGADDLFIALRRNLLNPDGSGTSIAIMPFATLPVGASGIGAGDWGAGVIVPLSFSLFHKLQLSFSPEVDAADNQSGNGRHLAYGNVTSLSLPLSQTLTAQTEIAWSRDDDPSGQTSKWRTGASLGWEVGENTQLDIGATFALNHNAPHRELYLGVAHRF